MEKLTIVYHRLQVLYDTVEDIKADLVEKQAVIEENANTYYRDLTENEQERWDTLYEMILALLDCQENIQSAQYDIERYCN